MSRAQNSNRKKNPGNLPKSNAVIFAERNFLKTKWHYVPRKTLFANRAVKKGHFTKVTWPLCNSKGNVDNESEGSESTAEEDCNFITSDSESEFSILMISESVGTDNRIQSQPILLSNLSRSTTLSRKQPLLNRIQ